MGETVLFHDKGIEVIILLTLFVIGLIFSLFYSQGRVLEIDERKVLEFV